jgi:SAM-dependent methyltransferase
VSGKIGCVPSSTDRSHLNRRRAESFGDIAQRYDEYRPSYPPALVDDLVAGHPSTALDVGAGTGRASALLAARGVDVLGVEVDERMADVAREHGLSVEVGTFEDWDDLGRRFDLLVCGQAWHWIDPDVGARKALTVLRPGGLLALFWNIGTHEPEARTALDAVYADVAPDMPRSVLRGGNRSVEPHLKTLGRAGFVGLEHRSYPWTQTYSREQWLALIGTHSDHSTLPAEQFAALSARVAAVVDGLGGSITTRYVTEALLAHRP